MKWKPHSQRENQNEDEALSKNRMSAGAHLWQRLGLGGICLLFCMGFIFRVYIKSFLWLPVDLHSELKADYSADGLVPRMHTIQLELIRDAIHDQLFSTQNEDGAQNDRYATLVSELQTPVATVTPQYPETRQPTSSTTQTPTLLSTTATMTQTVTSTATATATTTALEVTATTIPTQAFITSVPKPTSTKPPQPTKTKIPPTQIPPTATKPPTKIPPTATKPPPTRPPYPGPTINPYP
jgi:hypothetical protein